MPKDTESEGEERVLRYDPAPGSFVPAGEPDRGVREALDAHLDRHLGECDSVWHEIPSDLVHLDVYIWRPTTSRPMFTFVTVGASDRQMAVPEAVRDRVAPRIELVLSLPPEWPVPTTPYGTAAWKDESAYYPIRWLKEIGRFPHRHHTWLGFGHSLPNGDPPAPLDRGTDLCGWVLLPPMTLPESFWSLELSGSDRIALFGMIAVTRDEIDEKVRNGVESLFEGFDRDGVSELLNPRRCSSLAH